MNPRPLGPLNHRLNGTVARSRRCRPLVFCHAAIVRRKAPIQTPSLSLTQFCHCLGAKASHAVTLPSQDADRPRCERSGERPTDVSPAWSQVVLRADLSSSSGDSVPVSAALRRPTSACRARASRCPPRRAPRFGGTRRRIRPRTSRALELDGGVVEMVAVRVDDRRDDFAVDFVEEHEVGVHRPPGPVRPAVRNPEQVERPRGGSGTTRVRSVCRSRP